MMRWPLMRTPGSAIISTQVIEAYAGERGNHGRVRVLRIPEGGFPRATEKESRAIGQLRQFEKFVGRRALPGDRWLDDLMRYVIQAEHGRARQRVHGADCAGWNQDSTAVMIRKGCQASSKIVVAERVG